MAVPPPSTAGGKMRDPFQPITIGGKVYTLTPLGKILVGTFGSGFIVSRAGAIAVTKRVTEVLVGGSVTEAIVQTEATKIANYLSGGKITKVTEYALSPFVTITNVEPASAESSSSAAVPIPPATVDSGSGLEEQPAIQSSRGADP